MPLNFIDVTPEELASYIHIPTYRTRTRTHHINELYYDPGNKRFIRKYPSNGKWIEKVMNPDRQTLIVYIGDKLLAISYAELQKQYPGLKGLYDPSKPVRIRRKKESRESPLEPSSTTDFSASALVDSFLDELSIL